MYEIAVLALCGNSLKILLASHDVTCALLIKYRVHAPHKQRFCSVYEEGAPHVHPDLWAAIDANNWPVLGICYGFQEMALHLGGSVEAADKREYGNAMLRRTPPVDLDVTSKDILDGVDSESQVWMSHGDKITQLPPDFVTIGVTDNAEHAAMVHPTKHWYGLQFHPEVGHSKQGSRMLRNFVLQACRASSDWTMASFVSEAVRSIREMVGPEGQVMGAVSGGVDSTVAAVLLHRAIGDRFHAVMVDNGVLRKNESTEVLKRLREECGVNLTLVDAADQFLDALDGVSDPEKKRKIIGNTFIDVFEREAAKLPKCDFLLQGTLYPDVIESVSFKGPSATIKTHHNVGGLKDIMKLKLIEPLRELFKDEVRALGQEMGLPRSSVYRHPFPGPGLAIRCIGAISRPSIAMLREADAIYMEELVSNGEYYNIGQAFVVLLPVKSVGVMGDGRTYEQVVAIRAVETSDYMTADWYRMPYDKLARISTRIINEVKGINRVTYDISSKPPATIEWE